MDKPLPLDEQLCFSLYAATIAINRTYKPMLDRMGITYPQFLVLLTLSDSEDGLTIGAIAERLSLEPSTITPLAKRMEAAGLVDRLRNPEDERQVLVRLTEAGRARWAESGCLAPTVVARSGMTPERLIALNGEVTALRRALDAALG
ncbi:MULTISPECIES: MarR family winged helix-turn-helix transcriptional regulator [Sphingomonas]|uniref:MarR family transcriptional regulator n=1 Tax=Sphingomonas hankookensis TaxID=563996 RepID=A0ABR5YCL4_9SPHN|nr:MULTISPECIES: MarR family transcriptional regulator [Sphingomonas]KZE13452.1 MarR family transcriptional regulator [Sphingomonas hankookensis]PZT90978.1 MAG: MarR family transcriptional regulator [Sphingomonas sp.]RSV30982.1 MarR family transcriptional regulator [Sphingomonas sp. ABOLH]WCP72015.1 MarR family transcriptional regulator [Sphingomonas hankookensis]